MTHLFLSNAAIASVEKQKRRRGAAAKDRQMAVK